ncbi:hypothetical protein QFE97_02910 [Bacillus subtilis]|nr:hypothetical protein QFE97_02910 [Bacillus subtilis]
MKNVDVPDSVLDVSSFLMWWKRTLDDLPGQVLNVRLFSDDLSLETASSSVVRASGHSFDGLESSLNFEDRPGRDLIFTETILVDTETDIHKRRIYFEKYSLLLESVAAQENSGSFFHLHISHCSIDKVEQVIGLSALINRFNRGSYGFGLLLGLYDHPDSGYLLPENPNIDESRLPNKTQEKLVGDNFNRAISLLTICDDSNRLILRGAIDDDDHWVPWAMGELLEQSHRFWQLEGSSLRVLALARQFVYYPLDEGRLDFADMSAVLNGSKVYISDAWERLAAVSPWTLTEVYASNRLGYYRGKDVTVRITHDSRGVLVYVRGESNYSGRDKQNLYLESVSSLLHIGSPRVAVEAARVLDSNYSAPLTSDFVIDPPVWRVDSNGESAEGLLFTSNTHDFLASRSLPAASYRVVVSAWYGSGRFVRSYPGVEDVVVPGGDFLRPIAFVLEDDTGRVLAREWVRVVDL